MPDRVNGRAIRVTQPANRFAWVKLRDSVTVKGVHLRHTFLLDVHIAAVEASALHDSFRIVTEHQELAEGASDGADRATSRGSADGRTITVPVVANVVEPLAFERLFRESPRWVHGQTGTHHKRAPVRVVSTQSRLPSDKPEVRQWQS